MKDKRIAVLESRFGEHLAALLEKQGAVAFRAPALAEEPDLDPEAIRGLIAEWAAHPVKLAIFQTGVGTRALFDAVDGLGWEQRLLALLAVGVVAVRRPQAYCSAAQPRRAHRYQRGGTLHDGRGAGCDPQREFIGLSACWCSAMAKPISGWRKDSRHAARK